MDVDLKDESSAPDSEDHQLAAQELKLSQMKQENEQLAQQLVESQLAAKSLLTQKREELEKIRDTELKKIRTKMLDRKE